MAGYGFLPGNFTDKYNDTIGGMGSAIAIEKDSWTKKGSSYTFVLWALPDRGWNTQGTINYQNRLQKFQMTFTPNASATVANPSGPNLVFEYLDTLLLTGPDGIPVTGLDADILGYYEVSGFPNMPGATYSGDGYGGNGSTHHRISLDSEGLFLGKDGSFWVSRFQLI
jgi:hypothetical protein